MKQFGVVCLFVLFLVACQGDPAAEVAEVEVREVEVTRIIEVEVTRLVEVEVTRIVEVTPAATPKPEPTDEPTPEPTSEAAEIAEATCLEDAKARNYVGVYEAGDLTVEIARVLVGNKDSSAITQQFDDVSLFDDVEVVGEIVWIVTNNGDAAVNVYPDQGSIQVNDELIDLFDWFIADFGDDVGGEIPPGVRLIGGQWFGISRYEPQEINDFIVRFDGPSDNDFNRLGEDAEIAVDLSECLFEPLPEDLN
jgi:hypothetical protein